MSTFFTFTKKFGKETKNVLLLLFGLVSEKKGAIPTKEVMTAMNLNIDQFMEEWVKQWAKWDDLYRSEK